LVVALGRRLFLQRFFATFGFTQRWSHAPLAIRALKAGKHVYSAVPAAVTLEELDELVKTVEETGLTPRIRLATC